MGRHISPQHPYKCEQNDVIREKRVIRIYHILLIQECTGKVIAREQKPCIFQHFVPCLYTESSRRTPHCTFTNLTGCYILCRICENVSVQGY